MSKGYLVCIALFVSASVFGVAAAITGRDWLHLIEVPLIVVALGVGGATLRSRFNGRSGDR